MPALTTHESPPARPGTFCRSQRLLGAGRAWAAELPHPLGGPRPGGYSVRMQRRKWSEGAAGAPGYLMIEAGYKSVSTLNKQHGMETNVPCPAGAGSQLGSSWAKRLHCARLLWYSTYTHAHHMRASAYWAALQALEPD